MTAPFIYADSGREFANRLDQDLWGDDRLIPAGYRPLSVETITQYAKLFPGTLWERVGESAPNPLSDTYSLRLLNATLDAYARSGQRHGARDINDRAYAFGRYNILASGKLHPAQPERPDWGDED